MLEYRNYRDDEVVEVGDVVTHKGDHRYAFDTSIIERIDPPNEFGDVTVHLVRPHVVSYYKIAPLTYLASEHYNVTMTTLRESYVVWVTGPSGNKDNRVVRRV